jgi:hypothetical protein
LAADAAGGNDAILHGDVTFTDGVLGQGFQLDGDGDWIEVRDRPEVRVGSGDFTVSFWVRFASTEGEQVLAEKWIQTPEPRTQEGWTLTKLPDNVVGMTLGKPGVVDTEPLELPVGRWMHVAARRADGEISIFVDGSLAAQAALSRPRGSADSGATLKFGHRGGQEDTPGAAGEGGFYLRGTLDEIQLFVGEAPSDDDIRQVFETRSACGM